MYSLILHTIKQALLRDCYTLILELYAKIILRKITDCHEACHYIINNKHNNYIRITIKYSDSGYCYNCNYGKHRSLLLNVCCRIIRQRCEKCFIKEFGIIYNFEVNVLYDNLQRYIKHNQ